MKIKILSYFIAILIVATAFWIQHISNADRLSAPSLSFKISEPFNDDISILIDGEQVFKTGQTLTALSLTTTRPTTVSVAGQKQTISIDKLAANKIIPLEIQFTDKKIRYFLRTLPQTFPWFRVNNSLNLKGFVLLSVHGLKLTDPAYSFITDMNGHIIYYRGNPVINQSVFHLQKVELPNGKIRYITHIQNEMGKTTSWVRGYHLIMDENFHIIDKVSILKTNRHEAIPADEHDIIMLDDRHYIVIGYEIEYEPLTEDKKTELVHNIIQEQKDGKVLLDWNSKDYPILREICIERCPKKFLWNVDYVHTNSLFIDPNDQNLLVSSAAGYYIMKIDRKTGDILWILGGKNNQFGNLPAFSFIRQHDVQITPDRWLTMFDNHMRRPYFQKAQILRLKINESEKQIEEIEKIPLNFTAPYMGSVQELPNRRFFIGCGSANLCTARMIDRNGNVLWNIKAQNPYKMFKAYYYETLTSEASESQNPTEISK